jgi:hypothetical protein
MNAFLEKINNEWLDDFVYITKYPLIRLGYKIVPFDGVNFTKGIKEIKFRKNDILIGSVESTKLFFKKIGINAPKYIGYPNELNEFYKRNIQLKKIKDVINYPCFIKPAYDVKLFTGDIIDNENSFKLFKSFFNINDELDIYISNVIDIKAEYRCFVYKKQLKGIHFYIGDYRFYPDVKIIEKIINKYIDQPIAYSIDVGINNNNETILIEINDMWAIGHYGFDKNLYTKMCVSRIKEIKINNIS